MEDSAIHHENRVSYLLGQHDLDLIKSGTAKSNKRTNIDTSSTSTLGIAQVHKKKSITRDIDEKKRTYMNSKNMPTVTSNDRQRSSNSPGLSDSGKKDKKGLRSTKNFSIKSA